MNNPNPGDRVGYAAKFLRNTGQFTGAAPQKRGTYVGPDKHNDKFGRVHWDDEAERIAAGQGNYAEADYCEDVRLNGSLVFLGNIARVGSPRFALNDL
jgi:hypothetical protein